CDGCDWKAPFKGNGVRHGRGNMKIWMGYGSEHSANLVIIGKFKSAEEAQDAIRLIERMSEAAVADMEDGNIVPGEISTKITDRFLKISKDEKFYSLGHGDAEQLLNEFHHKQVGDSVVI